MSVRLGALGDLPAIVQIAAETGTTAQWHRQHYEAALRGETLPRRLVFVHVINPSIVGFAVLLDLGADWELENIAVAPASQRRGIARELLEAAITSAREHSTEAIHLEVRESNQPARKLYERCNFQVTGRRAGYYSHPQDDAILYRLALGRL